MPFNDAGLIYSLPEHNIAATGISLAVGTIDPLYPLTRAVDGDPAIRAIITPAAGAVEVLWDHTSATRMDVFQLNVNNIPSGATVRIKRGTSPTTGFAQDVLLTVTQGGDGFPNNAWANFVNATGYDVGGFRYTRLVIATAGATPLQFGEFWLGRIAYQLDPNIEWNLELPMRRLITTKETGYGTQHIYDHLVTMRQLIGNVNTSSAGYTQLTTLWKATYQVLPFFVAYDPLVADSFIATWPNGFIPTLKFFEDIDVPFPLNEMSRGLRP